MLLSQRFFMFLGDVFPGSILRNFLAMICAKMFCEVRVLKELFSSLFSWFRLDYLKGFFQRPFHVFLLICFWEPFWEKTLSNYFVSCEVLFVISDCQCRMVFPIPFFYLVYVKYTLLYSISNWERCICVCVIGVSSSSDIQARLKSDTHRTELAKTLEIAFKYNNCTMTWATGL